MTFNKFLNEGGDVLLAVVIVLAIMCSGYYYIEHYCKQVWTKCYKCVEWRTYDNGRGGKFHREWKECIKKDWVDCTYIDSCGCTKLK